MNCLNILLIEERESDKEKIQAHLKSAKHYKYRLEWVNDYQKARELIFDADYDVFLIDLEIGKKRGMSLLKALRNEDDERPVIMLTNEKDQENDILAMSSGANDFIIKSELSENMLERTIRYNQEKFLNRQTINLRKIRYKELFEKSLDAVLLVDHDFFIQEANAALGSLIEQKVAQIKKQSLGKLFAERSAFEELCARIIEQGLIKKFECELINSNGERRLCHISAVTLFDLENQISGYQLIIKDETESKKNEQKILRAEKLGMTGRIARSIAHEVRNPLTNINLALDQLRSEGNEDDSNKTYIDIIERGSERVNSLITELLNSSKPTELDLQEQSILQCLKSALELASDRIKLKQINLSLEAPKDFNILIDEPALKTAILNILINATEAIEEKKGEILIRIYQTIHEVHISIRDNGRGMNKEAVNRLFDPFYTDKHSGMGLGMTATQNIIQQHGGNIDVESKIGQGTEFIINLPKPNING